MPPTTKSGMSLRPILIGTAVAIALFTFLPSRGSVSMTTAIPKAPVQISPSGDRPHDRPPEPEAPEPAKPVPPGTWGLCVAVDPTSTYDTEALGNVRTAAGKLAVPARVLVSLREGGTVAGFPPEDVLKPSAAIGVATAFTACTARAAAFAGLMFCESRNCAGDSLDDVVKQSAQRGVGMDKRHTVFAVTGATVKAVGPMEENLHPAIDGLAVDYAIRSVLARDPSASAVSIMKKVSAMAHREQAATVQELLDKSGQEKAVMSEKDAFRRDRCGASNVIGAKYVSNGTALVTVKDAGIYAATPIPVDPEFRACVMTGEGVRFKLCGGPQHCIFGAARGLIAIEKRLQQVGDFPAIHSPHRQLRAGWQDRVADRLAFLLKLAQDQPWRVDVVHGAVSPMMVKDAPFLDDVAQTYDAPIRMYTILLNTKDEGLDRDMHTVWNKIREHGMGHKFHYFYEPEGVGVSGAWNRQLQHVLQYEPSAQWVWVTQPDVFARGSYLGCFAKDTTGVQFTHSYTRLHVHASIAITRYFINMAGYFDENIFPAYGEDIELRMRVRATGIPSWFWQKGHPPQATAHISSVTFKTDNRFAHQATALWRRQAYLYKKWGSVISIESDNDRPSNQFLHPFNSPLIPVNKSWNLFDKAHRNCVRTGKGTTYKGCGPGCFFNLSVIEDYYPGALQKENQDPIKHKIAYPPPSDPSNRQCA